MCFDIDTPAYVFSGNKFEKRTHFSFFYRLQPKVEVDRPKRFTIANSIPRHSSP